MPETTRSFDMLTLPSPAYNERGDSAIVGVIVHCMGTPLKEGLDILRGEVSAHYFVPQITGAQLKEALPEWFGDVALSFPDRIPVINLVPEEKRAWHAGVSKFSNWNQQPGCEKGLGSCTIGIEFHAPGYGGEQASDWYHFAAYTEGQKQTGIALIKEIMARHSIPTENVLAHSTVSIQRSEGSPPKTDPGPTFFWHELYQEGLGYLPEVVDRNTSGAVADIARIQQRLYEIGFTSCPQTQQLDMLTRQNLEAYAMQFAPDLWEKVHHDPLAPELLHSITHFNHDYSWEI